MLLGFLPLDAAVSGRAVHAVRATTDPATEAALVVALAAVARCALYAATSLFLESPYLSALYWVLFSLMGEARAPRPTPAAGFSDRRPLPQAS
jgi:hypothetical protein